MEFFSILVICGMLAAVIYSASDVARRVRIALKGYGNEWAWAASTFTFIVCFSVFLGGMAMVAGLFFGR